MLRSIFVFAISATFLGVGLGRLAFSPLIPELVQSGWVDADAARQIGAANLIGYFVGAVGARASLRVMGERSVCIAAAASIVLANAMILLPFGTPWFWIARFLAGAGGAILMIVATAAAGRRLAAAGQARFQPLLFVGLGVGALFAAIFLPPLLRFGLDISIVGLVVLSLVSLIGLWGASGFLRPDVATAPHAIGAMRPDLAVALIVVAYAFDALGYVMHTVYVPDMLRRSLGYTEAQVGMFWAAFGVGACLGPLFVLALRRVVSVWRAFWVVLALKGAGVALILAGTGPFVVLSLFMVGMMTPGSVVVTSAALMAAAGPGPYLGWWAMATALFALCQMASGMIIAAISTNGYDMALLLSVAAMSTAAALALAVEWQMRRRAAAG